MRMLREPDILEKMAIGKTKFKTDYVDTNRTHWIYSGRVKRLPEHEVDRLIAEDIAAAEKAAPVKAAFPRDAYMKGTRVSAQLRSTKPAGNYRNNRGLK
jgi:hypothetical protein